jgi:LCP family protein required for cell wall assembly
MGAPSMGEKGMTYKQSPTEIGQGDDVTGGAELAPPLRRRRRALRIALISLASTIVLLGAAAASAFFYLSHEVGSIPRIPVKFLSEETTHGMTVLLTGSPVPTGDNIPGESGLIMLLHINADHQAGGAVSIPPQTEVNVPGRGEMPLLNVMGVGGPSLLTETVRSLTGVPINHYARIDFGDVASLVNAVGGVSVTLPEATESFGYFFRKGVNQLNGPEALAYARQLSLSETGRVLRQQSLMRAILTKVAYEHLLARPWTMSRVLCALTTLLTLDSTFTNSQVIRLATQLGGVSSSEITYVTAPTENPVESSALWAAIDSDSIASFARQHPDTVTPAAP